jgi:hypothetical protein
VLLLAGDMDGADLDLDASHIECLVDGDWDAGEGGRNEGNILFWFVIFVLSVLFIDGAVYVMRRQCKYSLLCLWLIMWCVLDNGMPGRYYCALLKLVAVDSVAIWEDQSKEYYCGVERSFPKDANVAIRTTIAARGMKLASLGCNRKVGV